MVCYNAHTSVCMPLVPLTFRFPLRMPVGPRAGEMLTEGFQTNYVACATGLGTTTVGGVATTRSTTVTIERRLLYTVTRRPINLDGVIYQLSNTRLTQITDGPATPCCSAKSSWCPTRNATPKASRAIATPMFGIRAAGFTIAWTAAEILFSSGVVPNSTASDYENRCNTFNPIPRPRASPAPTPRVTSSPSPRSSIRAASMPPCATAPCGFISNGISQATFSAVGTRAGGEELATDW